MRSLPFVFAVLLGCGDSGAALDAALDATLDGSVEDAGPEPSAVGGSCTDDLDCRAGLSCFRGPEDARPWPEGYCTRECTRDDDCPGEARCGPAYTTGAGDVLRCLAPCERVEGSRGGCREGYQCGFDGVCIVGCTTDEQCALRDADPPSGRPPASPGALCEASSQRCIVGATPEASHGDACSSNRECGPTSACFGAVGCLNVWCDLGGSRACPEDAACVKLPLAWDTGAVLCMPRCTPGVDGRGDEGDACPAGWACHPPELDRTGVLDTGYCAPALSSPPGRTELSFDTTCRSDADCPNPLGLTTCDVASGRCSAVFCAAESLADYAALACPSGGECVVPNVSELPAELTPAAVHSLTLGICVPEGTS